MPDDHPQPEADPRFRYLGEEDFPVLVRMKTAEELRQQAIDNAPVTARCGICERDVPVLPVSFYQFPSVLPGNICRSCADRHGASWGFNTNWRTGNRSDFFHLRALSAITQVLIKESKHASHNAR